MKRSLSIAVMLTILAALLTGCGTPGQGAEPTKEPHSGAELNAGQRDEVDIKLPENDVGSTEKLGVWRFPADGGDDEWGLLLSARDISPTGMRLCFERYGDPGDDSAAGYGEPFKLEKLRDGQWEEAPKAAGAEKAVWNDLLYALPTDADAGQTVDWENIYGDLAPGSYRLVKEIIGTKGTRDYYVRFDIVDPGERKGISYTADGVGISVPVAEGWEYAIAERSPGCQSWGIDFRPEGQDGWVQLRYWEFFGVCGTGLKSEDISLTNGMSGSVGTYDGAEVWDFIRFVAGDGSFVLTNRGAGDWLSGRNEEVLNMLGSSLLSWKEE